MTTHRNKAAGSGNFVPALLLFALTAAIALLLLIAALVLGLAELLGSLIGAAALVGGVFAIAAAVIYFMAIRGPLEQLRARIETVYDVARLVKQAYDWVADKFGFLVRLRDGLRRTA